MAIIWDQDKEVTIEEDTKMRKRPVERPGEIVFLVEETASRIELGVFSDLQELQAG